MLNRVGTSQRGWEEEGAQTSLYPCQLTPICPTPSSLPLVLRHPRGKTAGVQHPHRPACRRSQGQVLWSVQAGKVGELGAQGVHREVVGAEHTGPRCGWKAGREIWSRNGHLTSSSPDADEEESEEDDSDVVTRAALKMRSQKLINPAVRDAVALAKVLDAGARARPALRPAAGPTGPPCAAERGPDRGAELAGDAQSEEGAGPPDVPQ